MWEDEANKFGGKWIVRLRKGGEFQIFWCFFSYSWVLWISGLSSRCWENLVLAMLGEQFMVGEEICGAVVSIRFQEDILRSAKSNRHICWANQVLVAVMMMTINTESLSPYHMNWTIVCSIWNRTACDQAVTNRIRDTFRRVWILHFLHLLADVELIYWLLRHLKTGLNSTFLFLCWRETLNWHMLYIPISNVYIFTCCDFLTISFLRCWVSQPAQPSNTRRTMTVLSEPDFLQLT